MVIGLAGFATPVASPPRSGPHHRGTVLMGKGSPVSGPLDRRRAFVISEGTDDVFRGCGTVDLLLND